MFLLDTNVCIAILNGDEGPVYRRVVEAGTRGATLHVSSVSIFELAFGVEKSAPSRQAENRRRLKDFTADQGIFFIDWSNDDAIAAARVRDQLRRIGRPAGPYDTLIAGQALARGLTIVTANHSEFARIPGLPVEDWSAA